MTFFLMQWLNLLKLVELTLDYLPILYLSCYLYLNILESIYSPKIKPTYCHWVDIATQSVIGNRN
jgi:hypothetical protein